MRKKIRILSLKKNTNVIKHEFMTLQLNLNPNQSPRIISDYHTILTPRFFEFIRDNNQKQNLKDQINRSINISADPYTTKPDQAIKSNDSSQTTKNI